MKRIAAAALLASTLAGAQPAGPIFFDDFSQPDTATLRAQGWTLRDRAGHPGVPGARWAPEALSLQPDPAQAGNRLLRLQAQTDGTPAGTVQAQACHQRRLLHGTWAARVRFTDAPLQGADGDPVIQAFYAIGPLRHDLDPQFSEVDIEYLPNGGWGSPETRLYAISWQTVRLEPWQAWNSTHAEPGGHAGWRVLVVQSEPGAVRQYLDGRLIASHTGRHLPVEAMSLNLSLWFSPGGLLPPTAAPRRWAMDVDWVLHTAALWSPAAVVQQVQALRAAGAARRDGWPAAAQPAPCDL
ncbi:glycoside hydrolase family 16 protein [Rubrivivax rivuli]|uniref:Hydrolase n=1 Tax=Rubrivivax rivuli TaxID=1862385 RepID=A0A437RCI1_9BURK|nr:glycoside hydrolase family 16 protein [Rubrivivax rivuli]RVU44403.1 hydrolase [Rubrivivax rivuli]